MALDRLAFGSDVRVCSLAQLDLSFCSVAYFLALISLYFREIFRRKFIFFNRSHTHQTTKEVQTHSHLPSRTRTYAARQEDDGRERRRDAGAPLRHARSATARARCANGRPRRRDDGKTKVSRASPAYFPGSKSYFLAGVGIFPPIFPEIENDKRRLISDKFSGKIQPCQVPQSPPRPARSTLHRASTPPLSALPRAPVDVCETGQTTPPTWASLVSHLTLGRTPRNNRPQMQGSGRCGPTCSAC